MVDAVDVKKRCGIRDRAMLETLYATGMRVSELSKFAFEQVLFEEGLIRITGKGSKERLVPIGAVALEWIKNIMNRNRPFLSKPFSDSNYFFKCQGDRNVAHGHLENH